MAMLDTRHHFAPLGRGRGSSTRGSGTIGEEALVRPIGEPGMGRRMKASFRNEAALGTWGTFPRAAVRMVGPVSVSIDDSARER